MAAASATRSTGATFLGRRSLFALANLRLWTPRVASRPLGAARGRRGTWSVVVLDVPNHRHGDKSSTWQEDKAIKVAG